MKFLLEFVSCCAPAVQTESPTPGPEPEPEQENRALVRCKKREKQLEGRRWKSGATTPAADQSWKPSLCAISEDRVVSVVSARNNINSERSSGTDREKKRPRKVVGSRARVPVVDHGGEHDFRQTGVPMVIPAFAPMAFFC